MVNESAIVTVKAVSAGGLSMVIAAYLNDVEFVMLLCTGIFASILSFIYDWVHKGKGSKFCALDVVNLIKAIFYGVPMMFIVYYFGALNTTQYVNMPITVWGFIAMLSAGSAVSIVEWFAPTMRGLVQTILDRFLEKKV